ncbi:hypothetical protein DERF_015895 [Dermatophagoides farinae]|uniref:Uncharacterized protein n=1 Tax=Dermatophagoides farinae TaxID=6954 RepID=A0A922HMT4_DERFA|nr:hypothetical protein DERF_015895 [Dermatophagoides farinae]
MVCDERAKFAIDTYDCNAAASAEPGDVPDPIGILATAVRTFALANAANCLLISANAGYLLQMSHFHLLPTQLPPEAAAALLPPPPPPEADADDVDDDDGTLDERTLLLCFFGGTISTVVPAATETAFEFGNFIRLLFSLFIRLLSFPLVEPVEYGGLNVRRLFCCDEDDCDDDDCGCVCCNGDENDGIIVGSASTSIIHGTCGANGDGTIDPNACAECMLVGNFCLRLLPPPDDEIEEFDESKRLFTEGGGGGGGGTILLLNKANAAAAAAA